MVLDTLPRIAVSTTRLSRADLYDEFVEFHFENEQRRLIEQRSSGKLEPENSAAFGLVKGEDFILLGIDFSKRLSEAIYKELDGVNSVDYSIVTDEGTWKTQFFGPEARVKLLRESSQLVSRASNKDSSLLRNKNNLIRKKNSYEFSHRSILEYFYSCLIFDPRRNPPRFDLSVCLASTSNPSPLLRHPLGQQSLLPEPSIIDFLAERVRQRASFKDQLLEILWLSKRDVSVSVAAANAMTILVRAGVHFNGADLKRIQIPGSDLSRGQFDSAQFQGANLSGANFSKAWLRQADFSKTNMDGVFFGEMPYLEIPTCNHSTVSHDGSMIAFVVRNDIRIYDTSSRTQRLTLSGHKSRVFGLTFSTNSLCIASAGEDMTARVWYLQQLDEQGSLCSVILEGHSSRVEIVCFSPDALQLASYSFDNTIRVWDIELRTAIFILEGDTSRSISCLAWSPDGECILSSSFREGTLWMWKAKSGEMSRVWEKVLPSVLEVGYSAPDGRYLIVCLHKIVCIWDVQQDCRGYGDGHKWTKPIITLRGHTATVTKAAFSPNGQWIATSSSDRSVRLWEARTGALVSVMNGHSHEVENVAFLNDQMIISCGKDRTTRFWQLSNSIEIDQKEAAYEGTRQRKCHTGPVTSVAFSPHGKSILSCSSDGTIRLWDSETGDTDILVEAPEKNFSNVAWSFDGQQIAAGCSSSVMQYDLIDIGDNNGEDIQKKALTVKEGVARKVEAAAYSQCGAYSRCGRWFATGGHHGKVCLFDLTLLRSRTVTGQANEGQTLTGHANSRVTKVVFSADGHRLASITDDQDFFIWGTRTGTALKKVVKGTAQAFTFAPSGPEFAVTSGIVITLWDGVESTRSADELWTHKSNALCVAWSPCGQWIVSGDGVAVYLWKKNQSATVNTTNQTKGERGSRTAKDKWTLVKIVSDFAGSVNSVDWHPRAGLSGNALDFVTGSKDHSVGVWRIVTASDGADKVRVELVWGSLPGRLVSSGTKITDAVDLSSTQRTMLRQRQAIDESPLILTDKEP
ncbi:Target of rapamycin complex subunit lst8 [Gryganskiella cystojenkinii]|nr:Target of rapamycin complex subunit lst8 [Gryganskiella cystojenkinii]